MIGYLKENIISPFLKSRSVSHIPFASSIKIKLLLEERFYVFRLLLPKILLYKNIRIK